MEFRTYLENSDELSRLAHSLGEMPREEVQRLVNVSDRRNFVMNFGWSVPCLEVVEAIRRHAREPLRDVMAGTGYWVGVLRRAGINAVASDIHKLRSKNSYHSGGGLHSKITRSNALRVAYRMGLGKLDGDIFMSWPPYERPFSADVLAMLPVGTRVFYVGEGMRGATADASFHAHLSVNFRELQREPMPNWGGSFFESTRSELLVCEKVGNEPVDPRHRGRYDLLDDDDQ